MSDDQSEFFFRLTPERVLQAVAAAGFIPSGHCFALNALENRVYDVRLEDGSHVVAKFYRPGRWSRKTILDEHKLLAALVRAEIPVCAPLQFPDGDTLHEIEDIHYAIWRREQRQIRSVAAARPLDPQLCAIAPLAKPRCNGCQADDVVYLQHQLVHVAAAQPVRGDSVRKHLERSQERRVGIREAGVERRLGDGAALRVGDRVVVEWDAQRIPAGSYGELAGQRASLDQRTGLEQLEVRCRCPTDVANLRVVEAGLPEPLSGRRSDHLRRVREEACPMNGSASDRDRLVGCDRELWLPRIGVAELGVKLDARVRIDRRNQSPRDERPFPAAAVRKRRPEIGPGLLHEVAQPEGLRGGHQELALDAGQGCGWIVPERGSGAEGDAVARLLAPGGLQQAPAQDPPSPKRALNDAQLFEVLQHPVAREGGALAKLQGFLASAKVPDHGALRSYCQRLGAKDSEAAAKALTDAVLALGCKGVEAYLSRGDRSIGVRAYEGAPSFLLIGGEHIDEGSAHHMGERELRFAVGTEMAHLRFGHTRVTSSEVWSGAYEKGKETVGFVLGVLPALKIFKFGARIAGAAEAIQSGPAAKVFETAGRLLPSGASKAPVETSLERRSEELVAAHRVTQLTADRAGLLLCGSPTSAVRTMLIARPEYLAELTVASEQGLAAAVTRRDGSGQLLHGELATRVCALLGYYLSDDYTALRALLYDD